MFLVLKLLGVAVVVAGPIDQQACRQYLPEFRDKLEQSFKKHPYGLATHDGQIALRNHYQYSCEVQKPVKRKPENWSKQ